MHNPIDCTNNLEEINFPTPWITNEHERRTKLISYMKGEDFFHLLSQGYSLCVSARRINLNEAKFMKECGFAFKYVIDDYNEVYFYIKNDLSKLQHFFDTFPDYDIEPDYIL